MQDISLGVALGSASQISMFVVRILAISVYLYILFYIDLSDVFVFLLICYKRNDIFLLRNLLEPSI